MQTRARKRIEIIVEKRRAARIIEIARATPGLIGWTILPVLEGAGHTGLRQPAGVTDALKNLLILVVTGAETADRLVSAVMEALADHVGIALISDVEVIRPGHFCAPRPLRPQPAGPCGRGRDQRRSIPSSSKASCGRSSATTASAAAASWRAAQMASVDRRDRQRRGMTVEVRTQFATGDAVLEPPMQQPAGRLEQMARTRLGALGPGPAVGVEHRDEAQILEIVGVAGPQERLEALCERPLDREGLLQVQGGPLDQAAGELGQELGLAREMDEHAADRDPGALGDLPERGGLEALLGEQRERDVEQSRAGRLLLPIAAGAGPGTHRAIGHDR